MAEADREAVGEENMRDHRKVIVFSYFTDTVDWIRQHLEREFSRRRAARPLPRSPRRRSAGRRGTRRTSSSASRPSPSRRPGSADDRPLRRPRLHRRARRGREPPAGAAHHQLRPAVEPHAAGSAARPDRPHRQPARRSLPPLLLPRHGSSTRSLGWRNASTARSPRRPRV